MIGEGLNPDAARKNPNHESPMKIKGMNEAQFLSLLQKVLPKATKDPHLASTI
jgi:hypothetical protein